ncbi:MAG: AAA family ATPase, partial [Chloroflexi bacterium]|nr:AAA family ATPase [Chloroflexota bacterium]
MYIESIRAQHFGPLISQELRLASQFTVIYGPNESGKSLWYIALCASLSDLHPQPDISAIGSSTFPLTSETCFTVTLVLADHRRIELFQSFDPYRCRARNLTTGQDCTSEVWCDGRVSTASWLGLDHQAFLTLACLRQSPFFDLPSESRFDVLRRYFQHSAASIPRSLSVTGAVRWLEKRQQEYSDAPIEPVPSGPYAQARQRLEKARAHLSSVRQARSRYDQLLQQVDELRQGVSRSGHTLDLFRAKLAVQRAQETEDLLDRLESFLDRSAVHQPSSQLVRQKLNRIAAILAQWDARPKPPVLTGKTAAALEAELAALTSF